jgi:hypothetical protein
MASFFIFSEGRNNMDSQKRWQKIRSQLDKATKNLEPKNKFKINNKIIEKSQKIMREKSLSLIYDDYGNQIYEKTSDVYNFVSCKKTGSTFMLIKDDSKLIETQNQNDEFNTDFISYDSLQEVHKDEVKFDMNIDENMGFKKNTDYLYLKQEKDKRKESVIDQGIDEIINYINKTGRKELNSIDIGFIDIIQ